MPVFVSTTTCGELSLPTGWEPNARLALDKANAGAGASTEMPEIAASVGLVEALDTMLSCPEWDPVAVGVYEMPITQDAPAASDDGHSFDCAKNAPVTVIDEIVSAAEPVLDSRRVELAVVFTTTSAKLTDVALSVATGAVTLLAKSGTACGEPAALVCTVTDPDCEAAVAGAKVTVIRHDAAGASAPGQLLLWEKPVPEAAMETMARGAVPLLASWITELVLEPTETLPKDTETGLRDTAGAVPVPDNATTFTPEAASDCTTSSPE